MSLVLGANLKKLEVPKTLPNSNNVKNTYVSSTSTLFRACHRQWYLEWWHLSSQGIITCDTAWGQLNCPDNWKWWLNSMFSFAVCVAFALPIDYHCCNTRRLLQHSKSIRYSRSREMPLQVPWFVWIPCLGHMNLCTSLGVWPLLRPQQTQSRQDRRTCTSPLLTFLF